MFSSIVEVILNNLKNHIVAYKSILNRTDI